MHKEMAPLHQLLAACCQLVFMPISLLVVASWTPYVYSLSAKHDTARSGAVGLDRACNQKKGAKQGRDRGRAAAAVLPPSSPAHLLRTPAPAGTPPAAARRLPHVPALHSPLFPCHLALLKVMHAMVIDVAAASVAGAMGQAQRAFHFLSLLTSCRSERQSAVRQAPLAPSKAEA